VFFLLELEHGMLLSVCCCVCKHCRHLCIPCSIKNRRWRCSRPVRGHFVRDGSAPPALLNPHGPQICNHLNYQLRARLITFPISVLTQCLVARNVCELFIFSSNRGISHLNKARCIDELRGSVLGHKILMNFGFGLL